jgi:hypothetical protein
MARNSVLAGCLFLICLLGFLTISVAVRDGVTVLVVVSLLILGLLGFGVIGALTEPSSKDE